jgi:hypothetical protein
MLEVLQKLGVPAGIAGVIGALVVTVPFIFQIDERYAKADEFQQEIKELQEQNQKLRVELAQLSGFQQTMIIFMNQNGLLRPIQPAPPPLPTVSLAPPPNPVVSPEPAASAPLTKPIEQPKNWKELNEGLSRQQQRLIPTN